MLCFVGVIFGDIGQVSEILTAIQTVTDNEMVGNGKHRNVSLELNRTAGGLVEKGYNTEGFGVAGLQDLDDLGKGSARVDDVLDDDHVIILKLLLDIHGYLNLARGNRVVEIALRSHKSDLAGDGYSFANVRHIDKRALEDAHKEDRGAVVDAVDYFCGLDHRFLYFFLGDEDLFNFVFVCVQRIKTSHFKLSLTID